MSLNHNQEYLTTGQFAALCKVNKKTLFYYDEIGLFCPAVTDSNDYRYYSVFQLDKFALITSLKNLGMELKEIQSYLECEQVEELNAMLLHQQEQIEEKINALQNTRRFLREIIRRNQEFMDNLNGDYRILHRPAQYYEIIYRSDPHKKKPVIASYLTDGPFLGHRISGKDSFLYKLCEFSGHKIPGGEYLCRFYSGHTAETQEQVAAMKAWALKRGISIGQEFYLEINDVFFDRDTMETNSDIYYFCLRVKIL